MLIEIFSWCLRFISCPPVQQTLAMATGLASFLNWGC